MRKGRVESVEGEREVGELEGDWGGVERKHETEGEEKTEQKVLHQSHVLLNQRASTNVQL